MRWLPQNQTTTTNASPCHNVLNLPASGLFEFKQGVSDSALVTGWKRWTACRLWKYFECLTEPLVSLLTIDEVNMWVRLKYGQLTRYQQTRQVLTYCTQLSFKHYSVWVTTSDEEQKWVPGIRVEEVGGFKPLRLHIWWYHGEIKCNCPSRGFTSQINTHHGQWVHAIAKITVHIFSASFTGTEKCKISCTSPDYNKFDTHIDERDFIQTD